MNRRDFMRSVAVGGTAAGLCQVSHAWAMPVVAKAARRGSFEQDLSDRSPSRDPLVLERSMLVVNGLDPSQLNEQYLQMLKAGGVSCWHRGAGDVQSFADTYNFIDRHKEQITVATTVKEIEQAHEDNKISLLFGWQSAETLGDAQNNTLGGPPRTALRAYYQLGLRIVGIAYNVANIFGGGGLEPKVGLTRAGRRLVDEIHHLNIVLDVGGHTGEQTSLDAIAATSGRPVICSHTNVAAIADNPRCISDRLIEAIAGTGGVIGITAFNDYLIRNRKDAKIPHSPQVTVEEYVDQFEYIKKLVGVDHVGLGPDFVEGRNINYDNINRDVMPPEMMSQGTWLYVKGFENISQLPSVTQSLIRRGWSTGEIRKVLGENWLRVYKQVWGA
jgi:membrane dipeptidase